LRLKVVPRFETVVYSLAVQRPRLYLRLGDRVYHEGHQEWGLGAVVEEMTSSVEGGTCLVRILFDDGSQRTFNNDLDHEMCCYFMGLKRERTFDWDLDQQRVKRRAVRRQLPARN
jgi:hypothetical protein